MLKILIFVLWFFAYGCSCSKGRDASSDGLNVSGTISSGEDTPDAPVDLGLAPDAPIEILLTVPNETTARITW